MFRIPFLAIIFWFGIGLGTGWVISANYQNPVAPDNTSTPATDQALLQNPAAAAADSSEKLRNTVSRILHKHDSENVPTGEISLGDRGILESSTEKLIEQNTSDAQGILRQWLDTRPYDPQALFLMARVHAKRTEYGKALELALVLKADPQIIVPAEAIDSFIDQVVALYTMQLRETQQLERLLLVYQKLVLELPGKSKYYYQLAKIQHEFSLNNEALTSLSYILYDSVWGKLAQDLAQEIQIKLDLVDQIQVPLERVGEQFIVAATINGIGGIRLLIDTGASMCLLRPQTAIQIGLPIREGEDVLLSVASGTANAQSTIIDSMEVGAARLENVLSSILEMPPGIESDGLLGMNFLGRFNFFIDQNNAILYLGAR